MSKKEVKGKHEAAEPRKSKLVSFLEHSLVAAIIIGCLGFFFSSYFSFRAKILTAYDNLQSDVESLIFFDEGMYQFCKLRNQTENTTSNINQEQCVSCRCLQDIELVRMRQHFAESFEKMNLDLRELGKFIPYESYYRVHELSSWNNQAISYDKGACSSSLWVSVEDLDKWRNNLLGMFDRDKARNKEVLHSLRDYLKYIVGGNQTYPASLPVDINKLPIFKDKVN